MINLTQEQIEKLLIRLKEYKNDLQDMDNVSATREKLLTLISTIYGEKSSNYERCRDIGFSSWMNGSYSQTDRESFMQLIDGIIDSLEILR